MVRNFAAQGQSFMAFMVNISIWRKNGEHRGQFCPDENINISQNQSDWRYALPHHIW